MKTCNLNGFIILIWLTINLPVSGRTYFVKNGGNDANTGLSDTQAWAHHPWMNNWVGTVSLSAGDVIYMKRGDTWSVAATSSAYITIKQSGTAGKPITTTSYGTGAKPRIAITGDYNYPVIQGSGRSYIIFNDLDIEHWSPLLDENNGQCGIQFGRSGNATPHDWIISNCDIHNCPDIGISGFTDSYNIIIGDTSASNCATESSYSNHIYDCGYAGILLAGCDPVTLDSHFDVYYNYIHDINRYGKNGENAYGVAVSAGESSSGFPAYVNMRYNYVSDIPTWEGLDTHGGRYIYFQDNYIFNCHSGIATQLVAVGPLPPILDHCYIERNTIENSGDDPFGNHYFIQMQGPGGAHKSTNSFIRNNTLFYTSIPLDESNAYGIKVVSSNGVTIERNKIFNGPPRNCQGAIQIGEIKNSIIRNNLIFNWFAGIYLEPQSVEGSVTFCNNIVINSNGAGNPFYVSHGILSGIVNLYNNVILSSSNAGTPYIIDFYRASISPGASLAIKNNIIGFTSTTSRGIYIRTPSTNNGILNIDYNIYWNSSARNPFYVGGSNKSWTSWTTSLGNDQHGKGPDTDPYFRNSGGSYAQDSDFKLKDNSPAIDAGTVVGLATDYYGNLICGPPDIGAFEAQTCSINSLPACIGFIIENDTPSLLELTFSLALKNVIPAISSFIVQVNSITRNVNSIAISGNQVLLTLSSPVFSNDVVTVTYLKPSVNPVQSASGVQAGSFTDQLVINESTGISSKKYKVTISPNPAHDYIDISINGLSQTIDFIRIVNFSGKIVLEYKFSQAFILLHLPINLTAGIYIIQVGLGKVVLSTQKLVVRI